MFVALGCLVKRQSIAGNRGAGVYRPIIADRSHQ